MQTRRSFFRQFGGAVAAALAARPFITRFLNRPTVGPYVGAGTITGCPIQKTTPAELSELFKEGISPFWLETSRWSNYKASMAYRKALWRVQYRELRIMARDGETPLQTLLEAHYTGVREKQQAMKDLFERMGDPRVAHVTEFMGRKI